MRVEFFAAGRPQTKGSAKAFYVQKLKRAIITNDNPREKSWASVVSAAATAAMAGRPALDELVQIRMIFFLPRPKHHHRADGTVRPSAPARPGSRPDLSKLFRSAEDALTGVVFRDDTLVVRAVLDKCYAVRQVGCAVRVEPWRPPEPILTPPPGSAP